MVDLLLAVAFVVTLVLGHWLMSRLDRYFDSGKIGGDEENE